MTSATVFCDGDGCFWMTVSGCHETMSDRAFLSTVGFPTAAARDGDCENCGGDVRLVWGEDGD